MGPVTPLLAVAEAWRRSDPSVEFVWVGTRRGPEREAVQAAGIRFLHIPVFRFNRHPSLEWLILPLQCLASLAMAWMTIGREKPDLIASAAGYTAVPLVWVAKLRGIPSWVHQQDAVNTLTTRLTAPLASCITVAWERLLSSFPKSKTDWIGNPVRESILEGKKDAAHEMFGIDLRLPTVFVFGGGTGAMWINHMMEEIGPSLMQQANVIHITGHGKLTAKLQNIGSRYHATEFLSEGMSDAYAAADVIVSRAGMGTITELSAWGKPSVLIPLPHSPQEANARILKDTQAAIVLEQETTTVGDLKAAILNLLEDTKRRDQVSRRIADVLPTDVAESLVRHVERHVFG